MGIIYLLLKKGINEIQVLNKITGKLVKTITALISPRRLTIDRNDDLWIISDVSTVSKYNVNFNGTLSSTGIVLQGLVEPLALGNSPLNNAIVVVDGGGAQQLKAFDNSTGSSLWVLGTPGGYINNPTVTNDKFYFNDELSDVSPKVKNSFVCFQNDGSFWVNDPGNYRILHFSNDRVFIEQIAYFPRLYSTYIDANDPTRLFAEYLEFKIDYAKPLDNGKNGSWKLVRNWRRNITKEYFSYMNIFTSVVTLMNGRTYAILHSNVTNRKTLVELSNNTGIRYTGH